MTVLEKSRGADRPGDWLALLPWTPRLLKMTLRHVERAWKRLKGEVNFTDLFVIQAIQFTAPEVYDFLVSHMDALRGPDPAVAGNEKAKEENDYPPEAAGMFPAEKAEVSEDKAAQAWQALVKSGAWDAEIMARLVVYLVPRSNRVFKLPYSSIKRPEIRQGIRFSTPTDYWRRVQSGGQARSSGSRRVTRHRCLATANTGSGINCPKSS